jgi:hypothetical protein
MLTHLVDVSIRSLLLALIASVVLLGLRRRRSAALAHAVWAAVTCSMLLLFALGSALPRVPVSILQPRNAPPAARVLTQIPAPEAKPSAQPLVFPASIAAPVRDSPDWGKILLLT